jgi:hypothetical protein
MGVNRTVSTWGGRMVVVSQPDKTSPINKAQTQPPNLKVVLDLKPRQKNNITDPANNA